MTSLLFEGQSWLLGDNYFSSRIQSHYHGQRASSRGGVWGEEWSTCKTLKFLEFNIMVGLG